jgi:hypothetical protein
MRVLVALFHGISAWGLFAASLVTPEFTVVETGIMKFIGSQKTRPEQTLIAFDFDDTLLSPVSVMGSEAWFTWQEGLIKNPQAPDRIVSSFDELLALQNRLLGLVRFKPVEPRIPDFLNRLLGAGISVIICTSRGPAEVTSTVRELKESGIDLSTSRFSRLSEIR